MRVGRVTAAGDAVVTAQLRGPTERTLSVAAVLDTGFSDWLTLTPQQVAQLELVPREELRFDLADGSFSICRTFECEAKWPEAWRPIVVVQVDSGPLLGMLMLKGLRLSMDVIEPLGIPI
jgi:predicted aspartyl protease